MPMQHSTSGKQIGAAICVAEYIDPVFSQETGQCDYYKKILILTSKCEMEDCFYWYRNGIKLETPPTEEQIMALKPIPAPTPSNDNCEKYVSRFVAVDSTSGLTDVASLVAFVLANETGDGEYETLGPVDTATDEVLAVTLGPRPEDGEDMVLVDSFQQGAFMYSSTVDGPYSDVSGTTLEIPDPCNFLASVCLKRCVDKAGNIVQQYEIAKTQQL